MPPTQYASERKKKSRTESESSSSSSKKKNGTPSKSTTRESEYESQTSGSNDETSETFEPTPAIDLMTHNLDSLKGIDHIIRTIRNVVINPLVYPKSMSVYTETRGYAPNILLYGPPGTGKTEIAKSIANELKLPFYEVPASKIQSSFQGKSSRNFDVLIETVSKEPNGCIVFMDEGQELLAENHGQMDTSIVNVFKTRVQVSGSKRSPAKVIFIVATNYPGRIKDSGVLSRFELKLYIGIPSTTNGWIRSKLFLSYVSAINRPRCTELELGIKLTDEEQEDLENLLFFYNNRELYYLAQNVWDYIECSPLHAREFMYLRNTLAYGNCTAVYKETNSEIGSAKKPSTPKKSGKKYKLISPNRSSNFPEYASKTALSTLDEIESNGESIEWGFADFESIKEALAHPTIFSTITIDVLKSFYYYAKNDLRDYEGAKKIRQMILKGYQSPLNKFAMKFKSKTFNVDEYRVQIPNWRLDDELLKDSGLEEGGFPPFSPTHLEEPESNV